MREIPSETIFTEIDPDKMTQVFDNVITNAMKYSRGEKRVVVPRETKRFIQSYDDSY